MKLDPPEPTKWQRLRIMLLALAGYITSFFIGMAAGWVSLCNVLAKG